MTVQALAGASLNVGSGSPEAFIEASERGLDLVIIGGVINGLTHYIVAGKNYTKYEDSPRRHLGRFFIDQRDGDSVQAGNEG